jgi:hypothetical protein
MIAIALWAAAANAPMALAANDEAQWRRFVRTSLQRPDAAAGRAPSRLLQLQGVVRRLGDDGAAEISGPSGL